MSCSMVLVSGLLFAAYETTSSKIYSDIITKLPQLTFPLHESSCSHGMYLLSWIYLPKPHLHITITSGLSLNYPRTQTLKTTSA